MYIENSLLIICASLPPLNVLLKRMLAVPMTSPILRRQKKSHSSSIIGIVNSPLRTTITSSRSPVLLPQNISTKEDVDITGAGEDIQLKPVADKKFCSILSLEARTSAGRHALGGSNSLRVKPLPPTPENV